MTAHMCTEITPGCYRCELNKDEMESIHKENLEDAEKEWIEYRNKRHMLGAPRRTVRKREFIAGFLAGRES